MSFKAFSNRRPHHVAHIRQMRRIAALYICEAGNGDRLSDRDVCTNEQIADRAVGRGLGAHGAAQFILSDYDPSSELSQLSQRTLSGPMTEPVHVSDDLVAGVEASKKACGTSGWRF